MPDAHGVRTAAERSGSDRVRPRHLWAAGVGVACVALLGIVVVTAEGRPLEGPSSSDSLDLGDGWRAAVLIALGLAVVGGFVILVASLWLQRGRTASFGRRRRTWIVWVAAAVLAAVSYLFFRPDPSPRDERQQEDELVGEPAEASEELPVRPAWVVLALGGVVLAALAAAVVAGRRLRPVDAAPPSSEVAIEALDHSLAELEAGDPRAGVIAAYARLLEGFERCGLGREPAEAPVEHLRRGLAALAIRPAPAERLTQLFLEARFSTHPIGEDQRVEARAALQAARDDLAAAATEPSGTPA